MNDRRTRFVAIASLALTLLVVAYAASKGRWFRGDLERPGTWPTFVVPDGGFTVRFPTATPPESDLAFYLIDSELPDAPARKALVQNFIMAGGSVRGWAAEDRSTRYSVRVLHMPPKERAVGEQLRAELEGQKRFAPFL